LIGASLLLVPTVWFIVPYVGNRVEVPYLLLVIAATLLCYIPIATLLLNLIKERQESEAIPWQRILWLNPPSVGKAHTTNRWLYLLLTLLAPVCLVVLGIMGIGSTLLCRLPNIFPGQYVCFFDLAAPFFYGKCALAALVLAGWVFVVAVEEIFRVLWIGDSQQERTRWFSSALLLTLLGLYSPVIGVFRLVLNVVHSLLLRAFRSFWLVFSLRCMEVGLVAALLFAGVFKSGLDPLPDRLRFPYLSVTNKPVFFALEKPTPRTTRSGVNYGTADRPWEELDGKDLRDFDLSARSDYLLTCNFNTLTRWPEGGKMVSGFKPDTILDLGMNPGLRVRELHRRGIAGAGVGIGIIDNVFYALHSEYKDNLRWYEEINSFAWHVNPEFHGSAVTSIALGKRCGVAPDADLYYIGLNGILFAGLSTGHSIGYAINRLVSINEKLPQDRKIRVISISIEVGYPCPGLASAVVGTLAWHSASRRR